LAPLRIAVVQLPAVGADPTAVRLALAAVRGAAEEGARLVLLPAVETPLTAEGRTAWREAAARWAEAARAARVHLAVGLMRPRARAGGRSTTMAALFDPDGRLTALRRRADRPVDSAIGRLGLLVGAEASRPQAARALAEEGVDLLLCVGGFARPGSALAHDDLDPDEHLVARAGENGVAAAMAVRTGGDGPVAVCAGRSVVCDAAGQVLARARGEGADLLVADVEPSPARPRRIPGADGLAPVAARRHEAAIGAVAVAVATGPDHGTWAPAVARLRPRLTVLAARPAASVPEPWLARWREGWARAAVPGGATREMARAYPWRTEERVVDVGGVRAGVLFGDEAAAPEPAAALARAGATLLVLFADALGPEAGLFWGRVRAAEEGLAVVVAHRLGGGLIDRGGRLLERNPGRGTWIGFAPVHAAPDCVRGDG
jgi:predicted amidohydrolase